MYILGISCYYHDSAASLIKDGKIVAAAEEERFSRKKHDNSFPVSSINFCLDKEGITINDVDAIAFYEKPILKFERVLFQVLESFPRSFGIFVKFLPWWLGEKLRLKKVLKKKLKYKKDIYFVPHHLSHASSYFHSPFEKAAIVTVDGVGEWTTTALGAGEGNKIILEKEIKFPHSLGLFYSSMTAYLGFKVNNDEYKVMGLSAYGNNDKNSNKYYEKLKKVIDVKDDGSFSLDMSYFSFLYASKMPSSKLEKLLEGKIRKFGEEVLGRHKDIAAATQMVYEEIFFKILNFVQRRTGLENLVLSGGAIQNSLANGKIFEKTSFKEVYISPNVTDGGGSLGAAFYVYNHILENPRQQVLDSAYLGPNYNTEEIKEFLDKNNVKYQEFSESELITKVANLLNQDKIIGWFSDEMEFGPRALGHRSILANPRNKEMQDILNKKVKHREEFRPFAPIIREEEAENYFEVFQKTLSTNFMTMVFKVKDEARQIIPAVTHVDGTARVQTISEKQNKKIYDLLEEFGKISGGPVLINTSFNVAGEPIVCTPQEAYNCLMKTDIDYLVLEKFLIKRAENINNG